MKATFAEFVILHVIRMERKFVKFKVAGNSRQGSTFKTKKIFMIKIIVNIIFCNKSKKKILISIQLFRRQS